MTSKKAPSGKRAVLQVSGSHQGIRQGLDPALALRPLRHEAAEASDAAAGGARRAARPGVAGPPARGEWSDHRECHVGGDFLLIYRLSGTGEGERDLLSARGPIPICLNSGFPLARRAGGGHDDGLVPVEDAMLGQSAGRAGAAVHYRRSGFS